MNYYVYIYRDEHEVFYVGKGKGNRFLYHVNAAIKTKKNTHFLNRIRKMIADGSYPKIEIVHANLTETEAFRIEIDLISKYGRYDIGEGTLLNCTNGGDGSGGHISPRRGKTFDVYYGESRSSAIRSKISVKTKQRADQIAQMNTKIHKGKTLSEIHKQRLREYHTGAKRSDETKQRISANTTGVKKTLTDEQRKAIAVRSKARFENTAVITNGVTNKYIPIDEIDHYLSNGWIRGRKPFTRAKNTSFAISSKFKLANRKPRPFMVRGVNYSQLKDAANELGISTYMIKQDPTFKYLDSVNENQAS